MGAQPRDTPAFPQTGLKVLPTRSIYEFDNGQVHVTLTFLDPALPNDINVLSRPVNYITWEARSVDGRPHTVSIFDSIGADLTVNNTDAQVEWSKNSFGHLTALKIGAANQTYLMPPGDDTRINWGYAYLSAQTDQVKTAIASEQVLTSSFANSGTLPATDDQREPRAASDQRPTLALVFDLGSVGAKPVSRRAMVAYDEIYSIRFFGQKLPPYWRKNFSSPEQLLLACDQQFDSINARCVKFDRDLWADLTKVGGEKYAQLSSLAYRECLAANGLAVDKNGQLLMFTKENASDGDIATVDVIFPQDPMMVLLSPTLAKAGLAPVLLYGSSSRWAFPNAPHDLGTYPNAKGTDDGGEQMPVEESGNILILCDAIAQEEGNTDFVTPFWPHISQWAQYLEQFGLDPEDQLCTDDFMGHLAHNANLSIKAIIALGAYADLCRMRGETANADKYMALAKKFAQHWVTVADAGDHSLLAFDKPGTWSQKYNLVWDKILGLNLFPPTVAEKEISYYKKVMQTYGVPLDSRTHLTKTDWTIWSASMAENQSDFESLTDPIYDYISNTTSRDVFVDSYQTDDIHSSGMRARPVIGGVFIKMLTDKAIWNKWASMDHEKIGNWAAIPARIDKSNREVLVPFSKNTPQTWRATTSTPDPAWNTVSFNDSGWQTGLAPFGTNGTPGATFNTNWNTGNIWLRKTVTLPNSKIVNPELVLYHDDEAQVYINGVLADSEDGFDNSFSTYEISSAALAQLKPGATITIAVHCHQDNGGQGIDVGIINGIDK
jgi:hypothetical protein